MDKGLPWTEKYRPQKLSDVTGQHDIIKILQSYVANQNMANLMFSGTAGIGKTSAAVALGKELFGKNFSHFTAEATI